MNSLLPFSANRRVYRAFGHAIAADSGLVMLAPLASVDGPLIGMVDGCPVPWDEVWQTLEAEPAHPVRLNSPDFAGAVSRLEQLATEGWQLATLPSLRSVVFVHESGMRVAMAADLAFRGTNYD
ncbi:hypothetical protein [Gulbenkiania mobilis]|uniref:hypothetical protein n=1 Tax=Gulbenkiania mobilis TaxID=397457 RepID=UPI00128EBE1A|nr:hypothetical protein [Gulbenkiania mobilis]